MVGQFWTFAVEEQWLKETLAPESEALRFLARSGILCPVIFQGGSNEEQSAGGNADSQLCPDFCGKQEIEKCLAGSHCGSCCALLCVRRGKRSICFSVQTE
jgi:hypothetical protein